MQKKESSDGNSWYLIQQNGALCKKISSLFLDEKLV